MLLPCDVGIVRPTPLGGRRRLDAYVRSVEASTAESVLRVDQGVRPAAQRFIIGSEPGAYAPRWGRSRTLAIEWVFEIPMRKRRRREIE